jgi:hypothetical protein
MEKGWILSVSLEFLYFKAGAGVFSVCVRVCVGDGCHNGDGGKFECILEFLAS